MRKLIIVFVLACIVLFSVGCADQHRPTTTELKDAVVEWSKKVDMRFKRIENNALYLRNRIEDPNDPSSLDLRIEKLEDVVGNLKPFDGPPPYHLNTETAPIAFLDDYESLPYIYEDPNLTALAIGQTRTICTIHGRLGMYGTCSFFGNNNEYCIECISDIVAMSLSKYIRTDPNQKGVVE